MDYLQALFPVQQGDSATGGVRVQSTASGPVFLAPLKEKVKWKLKVSQRDFSKEQPTCFLQMLHIWQISVHACPRIFSMGVAAVLALPLIPWLKAASPQSLQWRAPTPAPRSFWWMTSHPSDFTKSWVSVWLCCPIPVHLYREMNSDPWTIHMRFIKRKNCCYCNPWLLSSDFFF